LMQRFTDRSLAERRATAAEAERRRIATELHDVIAHEITGIVVLAQAAGRSDNAQLTSTALGRIEASGTRALDEIRRLVSETRTEAASRTPIADGPQALRDRVESFGDRAQIAIDVGAIDDEAVWPVLDRVLVETLTNVRRHAGPDAPVTVQVTASEDAPRTLQMSVRNGPGTGGIGTGSGTGLSSLRERVSHLGGTVAAGPERDGWTVRTCLPAATDGGGRRSQPPWPMIRRWCGWDSPSSSTPRRRSAGSGRPPMVPRRSTWPGGTDPMPASSPSACPASTVSPPCPRSRPTRRSSWSRPSMTRNTSMPHSTEVPAASCSRTPVPTSSSPESGRLRTATP